MDWQDAPQAWCDDGVSDPAPLSPTDARPVDYRLNPAFAARFVGLALVVAALLVFVATALVALLELPFAALVVLVLVCVAGVVALAWFLRVRAFVLRCERDGYRVGLVRGAGVTRARWTEVAEAVAASPRGIPCVVLRLTDGRSTTIPVQAIALDRDAFARELQQHLQRGQGRRPL